MEEENVLIVLNRVDGDVEFDDNIKPRPFDHLNDFHLMVDEKVTWLVIFVPDFLVNPVVMFHKVRKDRVDVLWLVMNINDMVFGAINEVS